VHGKCALLISSLARSSGGPPGSAAEQWRALARQQAVLAAAPDDEVLGELLVLQARFEPTQCHAVTVHVYSAVCCCLQTQSYVPPTYDPSHTDRCFQVLQINDSFPWKGHAAL